MADPESEKHTLIVGESEIAPSLHEQVEKLERGLANLVELFVDLSVEVATLTSQGEKSSVDRTER